MATGRWAVENDPEKTGDRRSRRICSRGGLELAAWCDLRVAEETATFGVFCRRWGVPLIDGGTVRLPRIVGLGRALDMILTGRASREGSARNGTCQYRRAGRHARQRAEELAASIAAFPQTCMRNDRLSAIGQFDFTLDEAMKKEFEFGLDTLKSGEFSKVRKISQKAKGVTASFSI